MINRQSPVRKIFYYYYFFIITTKFSNLYTLYVLSKNVNAYYLNIISCQKVSIKKWDEIKKICKVIYTKLPLLPSIFYSVFLLCPPCIYHICF